MKKTIKSSIDIAIRFSETDAMGVVWHGNYLKFFEDCREKLSDDFGMSHLEVFQKGYYTPIVKTEIDFKASIFYGQKARVTAWLELNPAAKIIFRYEVVNLETNEVACVGSTMQVFMEAEKRTLELIKPDFYEAWENEQNWSED